MGRAKIESWMTLGLAVSSFVEALKLHPYVEVTLSEDLVKISRGDIVERYGPGDFNDEVWTHLALLIVKVDLMAEMGGHP